MNIDLNQSKFEMTDSDSNESQKIKNNAISNNLSTNDTIQQYSSSTNLTEELKMQSDIDDIDNQKKVFCCRFHDYSTEQERLGSHPALPTLLRQAIGPLCSQIVNSMYQIVEILSGSIPDVLLQKFLGNAANSIGQYNEAIGAWTVLLKVYSLVLAIDYGFCQGFLPPASFAFGAQNLKRIRNLAFHAIWIGTS